MSTLENIFYKALTGPCGVVPGTGLVVAVSGGADSMSLLHLLAGVQHRLSLSLHAVWIDHGLRPAETPAEKVVVREAANRLGIPLYAQSVDAAAYRAREHLSLEHAARDLRYAVLRSIRKESKAQYIAAGHTADDQTEEILLRLLRGSGRKGLAGMRAKSNDIIRPLLTVSKQDILSWLSDQGIAYCHDSSNDDLVFTRNRVRHRLLPFLEQEFNTGIRHALQKTADNLANDEDLLGQLTQTAFCEVVDTTGDNPRIVRAPFKQLHPALQRRVVERLLWHMGSRAGFDHILLVVDKALHGRSHSELHLRRGLRVGVYRDYLEFSHPAGNRAWRGRLFSPPVKPA